MLKSLLAMRHGLAASLLMASASRMMDDQVEDEDMGIIELDEDLSDVEKPPELPIGKYIGEVQDVSVKTSTAGNKYFNVKVVVPKENVPANLQGDFEEGAILYWNRTLVVTANSDRRTKHNLRKFIEALGLNSETRQIDPKEWMGCQVGIVVKHSKFNDETRAEIASLYAAEAPVAKKAPPAKGGRGGRK